MNITLNSISCRYGKRVALDAVSCSFSAGEMVAIIGPNGSGKSTMLRCINRIMLPFRGFVTYDGKNLLDMKASEVAEVVAYVPQYSEDDKYSTVFDSVLLGRKPYLRGVPTRGDYAKVADAIVKMGLEELSMRPLSALSGGERQRVMVARALAQHPAVILLDEPIASLDIKHQLGVMNTLRRLADGGVTVIVTIHDVAMAARYCNKTIMLKEGRIFAIGGSEIYTPENIRVVYDVDKELYELYHSIHL
ncbi:MAG: ABC transporter ATP-binding protein [Marinifilaceae bacterium]|nr:ABC transporter ATP-binding protein [Marinifilaceae bacterium]